MGWKPCKHHYHAGAHISKNPLDIISAHIYYTTGKCLIWNLELAIASSVSSVHLTLPYCQYYCLSPQVLVQVDNKLDIMCYVESDVYALGLLMWQLSKRCSLNGNYNQLLCSIV